MSKLTVKDIMVSHPVTIRPEATLQEAASKMKTADCGILPVGTSDNVMGMITDRDIVIRALAQGRDTTKEKVSDFMTDKVFSCRETDNIETAAAVMKDNSISRLLVKDDSEKVVGILSFGCILREDANAKEVADVVQQVKNREAA